MSVGDVFMASKDKTTVWPERKQEGRDEKIYIYSKKTKEFMLMTDDGNDGGEIWSHDIYPQLDVFFPPLEVCCRAGAWRLVHFLNSSTYKSAPKLRWL